MPSRTASYLTDVLIEGSLGQVTSQLTLKTLNLRRLFNFNR